MIYRCRSCMPSAVSRRHAACRPRAARVTPLISSRHFCFNELRWTDNPLKSLPSATMDRQSVEIDMYLPSSTLDRQSVEMSTPTPRPAERPPSTQAAADAASYDITRTKQHQSAPASYPHHGVSIIADCELRRGSTFTSSAFIGCIRNSEGSIASSA